jgi:hypothetical protein
MVQGRQGLTDDDSQVASDRVPVNRVLSPAANAITAASVSYWDRWTTVPWPDTELANKRISG